MALSRRILYDEECIVHGVCSPTLPPPWSPPSTPIHINNRSHVRSLVVVVAAAVLALCLLSLACYAIHRYRSYRRRRRTAATLAAAWGPPQPLADDLLLVGGGGGEEQPYHVWYIRTVGLEQAMIGTIAVCEYRKEEGLVEGTDCAVCLGEFADGEQLRLLPKCSHAFHVPCIDTWLRSHVNCPLCRAPVLAPPPPRHLPPPPPLPSPSEAAAAVPSAVQAAAGEDPEEDGNSTVSPLPAEVPSSMGSFSSEESEIWVPIDLGDGGLGAEMVASYDTPAPEEDRDVELQPVGRSMSMDSSAVASLLLRMRLAGCSRDGGRKPSDGSAIKKGGTGEDNRKGAPWPDAPPLEMERSMSGGRLFLSRLSGRARGGIGILPL